MTLARLFNDFELEEFNFKSRTAEEGWAGLQSTPETVQLKAALIIGDRVRLTGKRTVKLAEQHRDLLRRINSEPAWRYITVPKAGWFNTGEFKAESIGFGDNVVEVLETKGKFARIKTLDFFAPVPSNIGPKTNPEIFHRMTVVTRRGTIINPGRGLLVYIFLISKVPLWLALSRLDFKNLKPYVPYELSQVVVTRIPFAKVRQRPSENSPLNYRAWVGSRYMLQTRQGDWGFIASRGWIKMSEVIEVK